MCAATQRYSACSPTCSSNWTGPASPSARARCRGQRLLLWELGFVRASGQPMHICGTSYLEFDAQGLVAVHRDFWDPVEEIFAKVPVLGAVARALQNKLRAPQ